MLKPLTTTLVAHPYGNNKLNIHNIMILVEKTYFGLSGGNDLDDGDKITLSMRSTYGKPGEWYLHEGIDQVSVLSGKRFFHVRHQRAVHFRQAIGPVYPHHVLGPLPVHWNSVRQQQVAVIIF